MSDYTVEIKSFPEKLESLVSVYLGKKLIFSHKFGALILNHKLSLSGKFLVVSLANSRHEDSGKVFIFDVKDNQLLFSGFLEVGDVSEFFFLGENENLYATNCFGSYEIDKNGEVVDIEKVNYDAVMAADTYSIDFMDAYLEDNNSSKEAIRQVIHSLDRIIDSQFNQFHGVSWAAVALRKRGEYLEMLNEDDEAFLNYIDAIYLDPKIGVKRKLTTLSKKMGVNLQNFSPSTRALRIEESCKQNREIAMAKSEADWEAIRNGRTDRISSENLYVELRCSDLEQKIKWNKESELENNKNEWEYDTSSSSYSDFVHKGKQRITAIWLALLTGFVGGHKFYLGQIFQGILCILLLPTGISIIWSIIDAVRLGFMSNEKFFLNYNRNPDGSLKKHSGFSTLIKLVFILFNIFMAFYLFSIYDRAGLILGDWHNIPLLAIPIVKAKIDDAIFMWVAGDIILGAFLFFTRSNK